MTCTTCVIAHVNSCKAHQDDDGSPGVVFPLVWRKMRSAETIRITPSPILSRAAGTNPTSSPPTTAPITDPVAGHQQGSVSASAYDLAGNRTTAPTTVSASPNNAAILITAPATTITGVYTLTALLTDQNNQVSTDTLVITVRPGSTPTGNPPEDAALFRVFLPFVGQ